MRALLFGLALAATTSGLSAQAKGCQCPIPDGWTMLSCELPEAKAYAVERFTIDFHTNG